MIRLASVRSRIIAGAVVLAAGLAVTGIAVAASSSAASSNSSAAPKASSSTGAAGRLQNPEPSTAAEVPAAGVTASTITIPAIGVSTSLEQLGLDATGKLLPPVSFNKAGWYSGGVLPGQVGPAIIAGHIDSVTAPAVFARLHELVAGDRITVGLSDGTSVDFVVDRSEQAAKSQFPTSDVYGNTPTPQLRVITCSGTFDKKSGHYDDNLVVFASLASP